MKECVSAYGASALQFLYNYAVGQGAYGGQSPLWGAYRGLPLCQKIETF